MPRRALRRPGLLDENVIVVEAHLVGAVEELVELVKDIVAPVITVCPGSTIASSLKTWWQMPRSGGNTRRVRNACCAQRRSA